MVRTEEFRRRQGADEVKDRFASLVYITRSNSTRICVNTKYDLLRGGGLSDKFPRE